MQSGVPDDPASVDVSPSVTVRVRLFSVLRERVGSCTVAVALAAPATGAALLDRLVERYPDLRAYRPVMRLAVNQEYAAPDVSLRDGDEVALITPVSGG